MHSQVAKDEKSKYQKAWAIPNYHKYSPGEAVLPLFTQMVRPRQRGTLLDIGAGTGRASRLLADRGWDVTMLDHVKVDPSPDLPFIEACIFEPWPTTCVNASIQENYRIWDMGYCCDVMEHIPTDKVDDALRNITKHCKRVFFAINFLPDHFGQHVGHPLHLTVKPFDWWLAKLGEFSKLRQARDLLMEGVFYVERK